MRYISVAPCISVVIAGCVSPEWRHTPWEGASPTAIEILQGADISVARLRGRTDVIVVPTEFQHVLQARASVSARPREAVRFFREADATAGERSNATPNASTSKRQNPGIDKTVPHSS